MEHPPLVLVVWEDAKVLDAGPWAENKEHAYKPHHVYQTGFLLHHDDNGVILTQAWHPDIVAARDQIPIGMIRRMVVLQEAKPPRRRK